MNLNNPGRPTDRLHLRLARPALSKHGSNSILAAKPPVEGVGTEPAWMCSLQSAEASSTQGGVLTALRQRRPLAVEISRGNRAIVAFRRPALLHTLGRQSTYSRPPAYLQILIR